ncbi:hypothetical protein WME90_32455 [Sorangium sp. So ce375]|uniref:hypothetical protein n=1 Tax=Sorangium sp. So ce375 TaxID=3133306 RepID=UPI003F5B42DE
MKQDIESRLQELQKEYEAGQKMLAELDAKKQAITATLLRIEGAMQVLRDLLAPQAPSDGAAPAPPTG